MIYKYIYNLKKNLKRNTFKKDNKQEKTYINIIQLRKLKILQINCTKCNKEIHVKIKKDANKKRAKPWIINRKKHLLPLSREKKKCRV